MATVQGPLMSMEASGKLAGAIVFGKWKGRPTVRSLVTPANPKTAAQTAVRALTSFCGANWSNVAAPDQALWLSLAEQGKISNFNAFMQQNSNRFTQFTMPRVSPTEAAGTVPVLGVQTLTPGVGEFRVSQAITTPNNIWGIVVCASQTIGFTPGRTNVRAMAYGLASPIAVTILGLAAGTWYVRTAGFNEGGSASAFVAEGNVVVT